MAKDFKMEIAGQTGAVFPLFESTRCYCGAYLSDREPDFSVTVTRADPDFEREQLLEEARQEGFRPRNFPGPFLERSAIQRGFAEHLLGCDTLLFHGSTVALDGEGYLFTAKSGTGKSTHTRLWRQVFGQRAVMVNDDKPFLRITDQGVFACGAPWSGKHGLDTNITVPLKGICLLVRGSENRIRPAAPVELMERLLHESYHPVDTEKLPDCLALVDALAQQVPLWRMECNKDPQAAAVAWEAMSADSV